MKLSQPQIKVLKYLTEHSLRWMQWRAGTWSWRTNDGKWVSRTTVNVLKKLGYVGCHTNAAMNEIYLHITNKGREAL